MYNFTTRKALARTHAKSSDIEAYRAMLSDLKLPAASRIGFDRWRLAEELLYILLEYHTIEEIQDKLSGHAAEPAAPTSGYQAPAPRRNAASSRSIKEQEYPNINWRDMDNPLVRMADSIFSDRINCWRRLHDLEYQTQDGKASSDTLAAIVSLTIRHELCFQELKHFNDHGSFIGKHPFICQRNEREQVMQMLRTSPEDYFKARKNIELSISRYSSRINSKLTSAKAKEQARANLELYQARLQLYKDVLEEYSAGKK